MGRRKSSDTAQTTMNSSNNFEGSKIRFQDDDEEEIAGYSSNLDDSIVAVDKGSEDVSMGEPDFSFFGCEGDDDKTSADYYFDSYSHFGIHEVECSHMADMAKQIVETNGLSDVVTVLKGKIEEIELPVANVDIIISEWMGYFLLFENMLNTVLYARDKWLVDDGVVLPDKASLYLTAIEDAEYKDDKIEFWNNVYGFDMSCIKKQALMEPLVDTVDQKQIVTNCHLLRTMDISKMTPGDASFTAPFKLIAERDDYIHAFVAYFDVSFTRCHKLMGFSTGPKSRATHWKQTVLYLDDVLTICEGEAIIGSMTVAPNKKNPRDVDIMVKYSFNGRRFVVSRVQFYKMR
ncbi:putative protein arginine N-methyltransferase 1 [Hibiscus syriacus]|uniref:Protein arginine N-methyltransferase domain-containing protein n=1 Tax=Hibiscus syriacus TaxID=106335 RepID=A0A6A2YT25_HIBSY|nr:putative protein arginine N-methyltransferase 1 [Hibiscus syriacus]